MSRPILVRGFTVDERRAIRAGLRWVPSGHDATVLYRCQILLAGARGQTARQIAANLGQSDQWVRIIIHTFKTDGLTGLESSSRRPYTIHAAFDAKGCERLHKLLHRSPRVRQTHQRLDAHPAG